MLLPHPESDITLNIIVMSSEVLSYIKNKPSVFIDTLLKKFIKKDNRRNAKSFIDCMLFLYMIGAIEHDKNSLKIKITEKKLDNK